MDATHLQVSFNNLLDRLKEAYPEIVFEAADTFYWSPKDNRVYFNHQKPHGSWSLVHELSHALLDHRSYSSDLELLMLEVAAWDKAKEVANTFQVDIDNDYVQDCLDTYRDWLHRRSKCPSCNLLGLQINPTTYKCSNCYTRWQVSMARFCRPYRKVKSPQR